MKNSVTSRGRPRASSLDAAGADRARRSERRLLPVLRSFIPQMLPPFVRRRTDGTTPWVLNTVRSYLRRVTCISAAAYSEPSLFFFSSSISYVGLELAVDPGCVPPISFHPLRLRVVLLVSRARGSSSGRFDEEKTDQRWRDCPVRTARAVRAGYSVGCG